MQCPDCDGIGYIDDEQCDTCGGEGYVNETDDRGSKGKGFGSGNEAGYSASDSRTLDQIVNDHQASCQNLQQNKVLVFSEQVVRAT